MKQKIRCDTNGIEIMICGGWRRKLKLNPKNVADFEESETLQHTTHSLEADIFQQKLPLVLEMAFPDVDELQHCGVARPCGRIVYRAVFVERRV